MSGKFIDHENKKSHMWTSWRRLSHGDFELEIVPMTSGLLALTERGKREWKDVTRASSFV